MSIIHKTRVKFTAANKPNAATAFQEAAAGSGFRNLAGASYANGDRVPYHATNIDNGGSDWEEGLGTFVTGTPNTITRDTIYESSNADAAVDFSAGANVVFRVAWPAELAQSLNVPAESMIEGLELKWESTTSISAAVGAAWIPSLDRIYNVTSTVTISGLTGLTASTWYHVYLYDSAGTPTLEVVTTAPDTPYFGNARTKTGDTSRRYLGSIKSRANSSIAKFVMDGDRFLYRDIGDSDGNIWTRVLNGAVSTAITTVDTSVAAPVSCAMIIARIANTSTGSQWIAFGSGDDTPTTTSPYSFYGSVNAGQEALVPFDVKRTKNIKLRASAASATGLVDIMGYFLRR